MRARTTPSHLQWPAHSRGSRVVSERWNDSRSWRGLTFCIFSMSIPKWDRCSARLGSRTMSSSSYEYTSSIGSSSSVRGGGSGPAWPPTPPPALRGLGGTEGRAVRVTLLAPSSISEAVSPSGTGCPGRWGETGQGLEFLVPPPYR